MMFAGAAHVNVHIAYCVAVDNPTAVKETHVGR
ncbi:MAG: hypothetical protein JWO10_1841 [Microbacteriaceae bacterium]|nr:hypothetical protein [Microbacteriaceae bacterium]